MTFREYKFLVQSSLYRYTMKTDFLSLLKLLLIGEGFKYIFWMRTCAFVASKPLLILFFFVPSRLMLRHYQYQLGIGISYKTKIGAGFYISHYTGIFIHDDAVIGRDCNISQGVTIGKKNGGKYAGSPIIGDRVYLAPGSKIIGRILVGNDVAVGANAVLTKDAADNSVMVGIPAQSIGFAGSMAYVNNIDY
jgi:serine O-acetyltransferase